MFLSVVLQLFLLEELRSRKYHTYAQKIQRAYRRWKARKYFLELKEKCLDFFLIFFFFLFFLFLLFFDSFFFLSLSLCLF